MAKKSKILFYYVLFKVLKEKFEKMSELLISSFLVSDVSESLRSLTKNERMSESLIFLSESLICSFLDKNE